MDRAAWIEDVLEHYFPDPQIPLFHKNPYTLLIAVLLSAHARDQQVNMVTPALFQQAKSPQEMLNISFEDLEKIIRRCGLSKRKARAILALSQELMDFYGGEVPDTLEALESLPGVGHKTASVVMVQAFKKPAFPVDTHIQRCAQRWQLTCSHHLKGIENDLKRIFRESHWGKIHLQMILFARKYCPARGHQVQRCPICSHLVNLF